MADLRSFLDQVAATRPADLVVVGRPVSPAFETAAIVTKLEEHGRSPILRFDHVMGTDLPLVTNVCGSMGRLALALGCSLKDVSRVFAERVRSPIPPSEVAGAPCQDVVLRGDAVDLGRLPALRYHADDAAEPYITAAIVVARHPHTLKTNLSYHRMMIASKASTGILMERGGHLDGIFAAYRALGRDMPIAAFVGVHPLVSLGALYAGTADAEEYDAIGGLMQEPLEVVMTVTGTGLPVPAHAELVLEGHVSHVDTLREGPFGEFTGYGTGQTRTPVFRVDAMTHREGLLFQDIVSGRMEHLVLSVPALEDRTTRVAAAVAPGLSRVALVAPLTSVIAVDKADDDEPRRIIEAVLRSHIYAKHVVVVDADVDPSDLRQVMAAVALQTQADQKVHILRDEQGTPLDPSVGDPDGRGAKMGIDATRPLSPARAVTRNAIPAEVLEAVDVREFLRRKS